MYRKYDKLKIATAIKIYSNGHIPQEVEAQIEKIKSFFDNPTKSELIKLLTRDESIINTDSKILLVNSINCAINWTSIKGFVKNHTLLSSLFDNIDIKPIYTLEQAKAIASYIVTKSKNTTIYSELQVRDVELFLKNEGYEYILSKSGFSDIQYSLSDAGADGMFKYKDKEILIYLRYGSSSGGAQNDRYRETFKTAKSHPDKYFLFVMDGPEACLEYNVAKKCLQDVEYPNAIWSTVKLLSFIDFDSMSFIE